LQKLAFKIIHSTTLFLPAWKVILDELQLPVRIMPRDVSTRWNSTFDMLDFAIEYCQALDDFTGDRKFGLRKFELSESEWGIAQQLRDTLLILKDATTFFSHATPNLAIVIPAMDHIDEMLTTHSFDKDLNTSIRASLTMGKKTLDRYYSLTDMSQTYRIAMVLHPHNKLNYFK
ncbi:ribonuclease H-like domain-containing protein, partial [Suillus subalutaceus]|uniref:ribonuclease H-like domain-containing protein n=1 Tax=Suillus subalutaceus TaxID=48586 RepID=UPI001B866A9C